MRADAPPYLVGQLLNIPVDQIDRNPEQPRQRIDQEALVGLASSLRESGVIEPLIVRPHRGRFQLVAGERRWRAAAMIGRATVPAIVRDDLDDAMAHELAVIENMARDDLTPIEEARSVAILCETRGFSKAEIGRRVGRSREAISNLVRLLELPDEAQGLIDSGRLTQGHGRALLLCEDHDERRRLARRAAADDWSVRELERAARGRPATARNVAPASAADQAAVGRQLEARFATVFGPGVRVAPQAGGGFRLTVTLDDAAAAESLLGRAGAAAADPP
jgi:ParB family chromosome partitioning protein